MRLVEELDAPARDQQDLGREAVGVLVLFFQHRVWELAGDVDQPALHRVLGRHVDQPVPEGDDAVPLGVVDPLAGLGVDVRLVGGDAQIGDAGTSSPASSFRTLLETMNTIVTLTFPVLSTAKAGNRATFDMTTVPNALQRQALALLKDISKM